MSNICLGWCSLCRNSRVAKLRLLIKIKKYFIAVVPDALFRWYSHRGGIALPLRRDLLLSAEGMVRLRGETSISFCLPKERAAGIGRGGFSEDFCERFSWAFLGGARNLLGFSAVTAQLYRTCDLLGGRNIAFPLLSLIEIWLFARFSLSSHKIS